MNRTKFNVSKDTSKREYNGIVFDSALEMRYYRDVIVPKIDNGEIVLCKMQKPYELQQGYVRNGKKIRPIVYVSDFVYVDKDGHEVVIDVKASGFADVTAKLKRKIFWYKYPDVDYRWVTYVKKYGGWIDWDEAQELRRKDKKELKEKNNEQY